MSLEQDVFCWWRHIYSIQFSFTVNSVHFTIINTWSQYGGCALQRSKKTVKAVKNRQMTERQNYHFIFKHSRTSVLFLKKRREGTWCHTWSSRSFQRAAACSSCPTPQRGGLSTGLLVESGIQADISSVRIIEPRIKKWLASVHLLSHLIHGPEEVVEIQHDEGVPHGREGASEGVGLPLSSQSILYLLNH